MFCQIHLSKPPHLAYQPGETISGVIKYAINEPKEFERVIVSLKGNGHLKVRFKNSQRNKKNTYSASENYVDTDNIVTATKINVPIGSYEIKFNFKIPDRLPPTLNYKTNLTRYEIRCRIKYYIRIKFERPGWFAFSKHYRKEINVVSTIVPRLLMEPQMYCVAKKLMRLFSRKNATVTIKATILNSFITMGDRIQVNLEINNDTNIMIKTVETKLLEEYIFRANDYTDVKIYENVPNTIFKIAYIHGGEVKSWPVCMDVPVEKVSLQNSKLVTRNYIIRTVAQLPIPHRNVVLDIPVRIGACQLTESLLPDSSVLENDVAKPDVSPIVCADAPPSYWEVMGESSDNDRFDDENDSNNNDKVEKFHF